MYVKRFLGGVDGVRADIGRDVEAQVGGVRERFVS